MIIVTGRKFSSNNGRLEVQQYYWKAGSSVMIFQGRRFSSDTGRMQYNWKAGITVILIHGWKRTVILMRG